MNIEDKIKKLLRLSESANPHEAAAAAEAAARLLEEYQVDRSKLKFDNADEDDPVVRDWVYISPTYGKRRGLPALRKVPMFARVLSAALPFLFEVKTITIHYNYGRKEIPEGHTLAFGRRSQVLAARMAMAQYVMAIDNEVRKDPNIAGRAAFDSFRLAAAGEIQRRARIWNAERKQREVRNANYGALVAADSAKINDLFTKEFPSTRKAGNVTGGNDWLARARGQEFGSKVALGRDAALSGRLALGPGGKR